MEQQSIDHNLYSRQIGAYGLETMVRLTKTKVLLLGLSGVGLEVAKNLVLAGPQSVTVFDEKLSQPRDKEWNYYQEQGQRRAPEMIQHLQELNSYVKVELTQRKFDEFLVIENLKEFDVVVVADFFPLEKVFKINQLCRENQKGFLSVCVAGLLGHVFSDFGNQHFVNDPNGEPKVMALITGVSQEGVVYTEDKQHHGFYENDCVVFKEVVGFEQEINGLTFRIKKVLSPYSFLLEDFHVKGNYERNGYAEEVKVPQKAKFKSLEETFGSPQCNLIDCDMDYENMEKIHQLLAVLKVIWKFKQNQSEEFLFQNDQEFIQEIQVQIQQDFSLYQKACGADSEQLQKWLEFAMQKG